MSIIVYVHSNRKMEAVEIKELLRHFDYPQDVIDSPMYDANVNIENGEGYYDHVFLLRPINSLGENQFRVISELTLPQPSMLVEYLEEESGKYKEPIPVKELATEERILMRFLGEHCQALAGHVVRAKQKGNLAHFELTGNAKPYFDVFAETRRKLVQRVF